MQSPPFPCYINKITFLHQVDIPHYFSRSGSLLITSAAHPTWNYTESSTNDYLLEKSVILNILWNLCCRRSTTWSVFGPMWLFIIASLNDLSKVFTICGDVMSQKAAQWRRRTESFSSFQTRNEGFRESERQSRAGIVGRNVVLGFGNSTCYRPLLKWGKGKAVPLDAWSGPEGFWELKFPDFMTTTQDGGKVVSLTHRPPLPPGNAPDTHFC